VAKAAQKPPVKTKVDQPAPYQGITEPWRVWFENVDWDVTQKTNVITGGTVNNIVIITTGGQIADSGYSLTKYLSVTYTATTTLTTSDFGKVIKFNNGATNVTCYLPSVGTANVDSWLIIMRLGTGSLTIKAADSDTIEKTRAGGKIVCDESGRVVANVRLMLASETKWAILAGTGIWKQY